MSTKTVVLRPYDSKEEALPVLLDLIKYIHKEALRHDVKILDNCNWRTLQVAEALKAGPFPDIKLNSQRTGVDATTAKYADIEIKTHSTKATMSIQNVLRTTFEWDKQNDELRRSRTHTSDVFVLSGFVTESMKFCLVAEDKRTRDHIATIMKAHQATFIQKWRENQAAGRRIRDSISLSLANILKDDYVWHLHDGATWLTGKTPAIVAALAKIYRPNP